MHMYLAKRFLSPNFKSYVFSPLLLTDKNIEDGVHVFPLRDTVNQTCRFDVSILPENTTDLRLCFTLSSDASEVNK